MFINCFLFSLIFHYFWKIEKKYLCSHYTCSIYIYCRRQNIFSILGSSNVTWCNFCWGSDLVIIIIITSLSRILDLLGTPIYLFYFIFFSFCFYCEINTASLIHSRGVQFTRTLNISINIFSFFHFFNFFFNCLFLYFFAYLFTSIILHSKIFQTCLQMMTNISA